MAISIDGSNNTIAGLANGGLPDGCILDADINGMAASKLTGTLPDARFPATLPAVSGANLTGISTSSPTESYARANLSTTSFDNSGYAIHGISGNGGSNNVTVDTTNERLTPTVAGYYYVIYNIVWSHSFSNSGLTAYNGIYKNGSQIASTTIAIYDNAGTKTNQVTALVSMNGSSDYIDFRSYQNKSGQTMSGTSLSRAFMFKLRDN